LRRGVGESGCYLGRKWCENVRARGPSGLSPAQCHPQTLLSRIEDLIRDIKALDFYLNKVLELGLLHLKLKRYRT